ncbi:hypothetical protein [Ruminiclostridium papyrosolvens]|uniref:Uncharacterized protein n=1 Tax=Ruminiclostridium papyrosolvens C7 TaxID=1330534 RepID=U4QWR1_9FIRM|nr:hypothetical protein [Ruminiclostridium papyrosolvens]EPR07774.1 hypothetical protein L323_19950 [Ruminiclostridium papyrosolvens C7]
MEAIQSTVSQALVTVTISLIGLLAAYATYGIHKATQKVKTQTAQLKDEDARRLLNNALEDVEELTIVTVASIEQTTAKQLREAVKDGKAEREELVALSKQAVNEITASVKPGTQKIIEENLGNFRDYISKLVEEKVLKLKTLT